MKLLNTESLYSIFVPITIGMRHGQQI